MIIQTIVRKLLLNAPMSERKVTSVDVMQISFEPGQSTGRHLHPCPVMGYIVKGNALLEVEGEAPQELPEGSAFYEPADTVISRFDNVSPTAPLTFIVCYLLHGRQELIEFLPEQSS